MGKNYEDLYAKIISDSDFAMNILKNDPGTLFEVLRLKKQEDNGKLDEFYNKLMMNALVRATSISNPAETSAYKSLRSVKADANICVKLPKDMYPNKEVWGKLGFAFTEIAGDNLFYYAKLPIGWHIENSKNLADCSNIIDESGRKRATMYSFNDKVANMQLCKRYQIMTTLINKDDSLETHEVYFGNDEEKLFIAGTYQYDYRWQSDKRAKANDKRKLLGTKAMSFAIKNYPDFNNPIAYWNNETRVAETPVR